MTHPVLLYDGSCGFCHRTVRFVLDRDLEGRFRFAPLQGPLAAETLGRHGRDPGRLDTVVLVLDHGGPDERLLVRSRAVLKLLGGLGWPWKAAMVLWPIPSPITDLGYRLVAAVRYRLFGKLDGCPLPSEAHRSRFLSADGP